MLDLNKMKELPVISQPTSFKNKLPVMYIDQAYEGTTDKSCEK